MEIPGYYNLADRGQQLNAQLSDKSVKWDVNNSQKLQLGTTTAYGPRLLAPLLPVLRDVVKDPAQLKLVEQLAPGKATTRWTPPAPRCSTSSCSTWPTRPCAKLGDGMFKTLLGTRVIDAALPRLAAADSPWWNGKRADTVKLAWDNSLAHLKATFGDDPTNGSGARPIP
jgi:penicillin amidase